MNDSDQYKTIKEQSPPVLFKDKGSKFFGYAFPVSNQDEVKHIIKNLKKEHHAARHWCYAYRLGVESLIYRVNDDGEPKNSAGQPIYGQIKSADLTNILIVVVRYFGGTKLGVGGLINAYKTAARESISSAKIITKTLKLSYSLRFNYDLMNTVMRELKASKISIIDQQMTDSCTFTIGIRKKDAPHVITKLKNIHGLEIRKIKLDP
ncbi:MAG: YigZ family protein [Flavobacteriaceae bacterium]|nr:YigZ family protein [Bacteroidia bacterium]NNF74795.1 YigZ family protein [Flavobacteriaceae bacterium]NNK74174.1 YigZ family protein [Flavobacteriaceae bacterium]